VKLDQDKKKFLSNNAVSTKAVVNPYEKKQNKPEESVRKVAAETFAPPFLASQGAKSGNEGKMTSEIKGDVS